ncbi:MAG: glycoside hydrolase family 5 protein [Opitutus sp.]
MKALLFLIALAVSAHASTSTIVEQHGLLRVVGNHVVGRDGHPVSLAGNSFFWSQWEGRWWNAECIEWLKKDWNTTIVRAAMGVEAGGYLQHPEQHEALVETVVNAATTAGLYVIIDWHDHHAERHEAAAIRFFQAMACKFGHQPNVIYEIYNEPLAVSWKDQVKPYAENVIAAIRAIDPDNLILVGSPHWSQDVDVAAADPIKADNIAYTLHFYAGTHKANLRAKAEKALESGVALVVSEWGTCNANGNGDVDAASTAEWIAFMQKWQLIHCNWAVSGKREAASIVVPGASATGGWKPSDLTASGRLVRQTIRDWKSDASKAAAE